MNPRNIASILGELRVLPMFPNDDAVLVSLVRLAGAMATSEDQVRWLVNRMTSGLYAQWPGPQEMRACFCSRFKPADGISVCSTVYLDGIPSERATGLQIAGRPNLQIEGGPPAGGDISADQGVAAAVYIGVKTLDLINRNISGPATAEEIATAPEWLRRLEDYE